MMARRHLATSSTAVWLCLQEREPDATASVALANMVLGVLDGPALERLKSRLCSVTAKGRHLEVLQCARTHGCP